jgi:AraC-like DNA-binding protein
VPSSSIRKFSDPDEYAARIRNTRAELTITARGKFAGELTRIEFHRMWMQRFSENLPRVAHSAPVTGRAYFGFVTRKDSRLTAHGVEIAPGLIVRHGDGNSYYHRLPGPTGFGAMSLPVADITALGETVVGRDLTPTGDALLTCPPPAAMAHLHRLHAEAGRLAREAPEVLANPDAARGLEQALIAALADCFSLGRPEPDSAAVRRHHLIMRRFHQVLDDSADNATIYVPELCARIGVSERTLRRCCEEQLGLAPKQFLLRRRLQQVHRALRAADVEHTTVTSVATSYGFWELGRFAEAYARFFGEAPSRTLRRSA